MRIIYLMTAMALTFSSSGANAGGSGIKVCCEGADVGAEVSVNGVFKGECPLTIEVAPGRLKLRVEKGDREFEQDIRMGEGSLKKVDVVLAKRLSAAEQAMANSLGMVPIPGRNYEMGKFEVTQLVWRTVMGSNPSSLHCEPRTVACSSDNNPVESVSWNDVQEFLQKLNAITGKLYRLPTTEEWIGACRMNGKYCDQDLLDAVGWLEGNSNGSSHPVGQKQANDYGLYDMVGNVAELLSGCGFRIREGWRVGIDDPHITDCSLRLRRGRSWFDGNIVDYSNQSPEVRYSTVGFRLARTLP